MGDDFSPDSTEDVDDVFVLVSLGLEGGEVFFSCDGEGSGEELEDSSAGISSEARSSPGSARTAILLPTLTPFEPSCVYHARHVRPTPAIYLSFTAYRNLGQDTIILCFYIHGRLIRFNFEYYIASRERITWLCIDQRLFPNPPCFQHTFF